MLDRGTVVLLDLDPTVGREQRGVRPCIVVSNPEVVVDSVFH
jgi:mRNA-degrading endonuclease toxin of MazEF toxin-antitoxin module